MARLPLTSVRCRDSPVRHWLTARSEDGWHDGRMYVACNRRRQTRSLTRNAAVGLIIGFIFGAPDMPFFATHPDESV
jgi:hypothetical protein